MCFSKMLKTSHPTSDASRSVEAQADRYVRRLHGLYAHLAAYVGVNAMLVVLNLLTSPGVFWAVWPILGWGVKLGLHAVAVFGGPGGSDWKARARRDYIRRHTDRPSVPVDATDGEPTEDETERLRRRIEHLETIVTSVDWDLLAEQESSTSSDARAATLADDVISG